jgi:hypothetical protein
VINTGPLAAIAMVKLIGHITQRPGQNVPLRLKQAAAQLGQPPKH